MLDGMSTDELSRSTSLADDHRAVARTPLLLRAWVVPPALMTAIFIAYAVPPYLTSWVSWVVNLLIVEWWLHRRPLTSV